MNLLELREMLSCFPKAPLALHPTPLHRLYRAEEALGYGPLWIKRDDLNGIGIGGNKVRNLEYLLGDAVSQGRRTVLVSGMEQSNLCALCAACCRRLGLDCAIVHNGARPDRPEGNALLNDILGAEEIYLGPVDEAERSKRVETLALEAERQGRAPYVIRNGASTAIGALGYVEAAAELAEQIAADSALSVLQTVCVPVGNGGLAAGLVYGTALLGRPFRLELISVEHELAPMRRNLLALLADLERLCGVRMPYTLEETAALRDAYRFGGWGIIDPAVEKFCLWFARTEGIFVEKVYTGKALYGVCDMVERGLFSGGVCYLHSGGIGALFSQYR